MHKGEKHSSRYVSGGFFSLLREVARATTRLPRRLIIIKNAILNDINGSTKRRGFVDQRPGAEKKVSAYSLKPLIIRNLSTVSKAVAARIEHELKTRLDVKKKEVLEKKAGKLVKGRREKKNLTENLEKPELHNEGVWKGSMGDKAPFSGSSRPTRVERVGVDQ